jgi:FixJ family two-component response regulator
MAALMSVSKTPSSVVYIVDDDDIILWTLKELVQSIGAHVHTFTSAKEFLAAYSPSPCSIASLKHPTQLKRWDICVITLSSIE